MNKNFFVKALSLILTIIFCTFPLISCKKEKTESTDTLTGETTPSITEPIELKLIENGKCNFTLLKPIAVSDGILDEILSFRDRFKSKTGINLELEYEDQNEAVNDDFEILIGPTLRPESAEGAKNLKSNDFFYGIIGNKLVIAGGSQAAIKSAVQLFFRKVIEPALETDSQNVTLTLENNYYEQATYYFNSFKIGDVDINNFTIVYSTDDYYAAEVFAKRFQDKLKSKSGYSLSIVKDTEAPTENEIVIGNTNRGGPANKENSFSIKYENGKLYMNSSYSAGYEFLLTYVNSNIFTGERNLVLNADDNKDVELTSLFTGGTENVFSKTGVRLLFNNIWSGNESTAPAKLRAKQLADVYRDYNPDVIGLQEYSGVVKTELAKQLTAMGYKEIPYKNSNNTSIVPRTPIYYNPNTLSLVDSGFWRFGDASGDVSKAIGWAVFKEIATGKIFIAGSTHFYWTSDTLGKESRIINARELSEQMKALSVKYDAPVIIGGDYNCNLSSDPLKIILRENNFAEAEDLATKTEFGGTHHSYPTFNTEIGYADTYYPAGGTYKTAIDHIFIYNESKLNVHLYDVIEDYFALASSDHCPMITDVTFK